MSQENVPIVRHFYEYFAATGEFPREIFARDAEFDARDAVPDVAIVRGNQPDEEPEKAIRAYAAMFDDFEIRLERVVAADDLHVVVSVLDGGRLKGSDARISNRFHHAWTFRDGKVVRWSTHLSVERALEAVGLRE